MIPLVLGVLLKQANVVPYADSTSPHHGQPSTDQWVAGSEEG